MEFRVSGIFAFMEFYVSVIFSFMEFHASGISVCASTSGLYRRFSFPAVNYCDCVGDCFLCVFPLDSVKICLYPSRFRKSV